MGYTSWEWDLPNKAIIIKIRNHFLFGAVSKLLAFSALKIFKVEIICSYGTLLCQKLKVVSEDQLY